MDLKVHFLNLHFNLDNYMVILKTHLLIILLVLVEVEEVLHKQELKLNVKLFNILQKLIHLL